MHFYIGLATSGEQDLRIFTLVSPLLVSRFLHFDIGLATLGEQDLCIFTLVSPLLLTKIYAFLHWSRHIRYRPAQFLMESLP